MGFLLYFSSQAPQGFKTASAPVLDALIDLNLCNLIMFVWLFVQASWVSPEKTKSEEEIRKRRDNKDGKDFLDCL